MPPSSGELWGHHLMPSQVLVDCLLPTGVIVPIQCNRDVTLERAKFELWLEAKKYPLFSKLLDPDSYIFVAITQDAEREEFYDETRRLCDLRLFQPILKVMEPIGNREEKILNYEIGMLIGIPVNDLNETKDLEVMTFRRNILNVCKEAIGERERNGAHGQALYAYPPDIESSKFLPPHLHQKIRAKDDTVIMCVWVVSGDNDRTKYSVKLNISVSPTDVIAETIRRRSRLMSMTKEHTQMCIEEFSQSYVLKVCGCDQFLLEECPIGQYKYIRDCIADDKIPQFMLYTKDSVYSSLTESHFTVPSYVQRGIQALAEINNQQILFTNDVNTALRIKISCASYVNVKEFGKIYVKAGIYHGTEPLSEIRNTHQGDSTNPRWDQWLTFLPIPDIPRSAKLCLSICSVSIAKRRNKKVHYALAWGNIQMFDFNHRLASEKVSLHLWPMPQGMDDLLNPIGLPGSNPDKDCPCLEIEFDRLAHPVAYPPDALIDQIGQTAFAKERQGIYHMADSREQSEKENEMLEEIISRDPLADILEQDKELLWKRREYCLTIPNSLPKLLLAVKWYDRKDVAQLYLLLKRWPQVSPEVGLELLDCSFSDLKVREFAVSCLDKGLRDDKLLQYLLQLVQALKYEAYLENPLTSFLLKRALLSQRIGNFFFWHLKSEIHRTSIRLRFGLILEAYCRGCGSYLKELIKQVEALDKLTKLTDMLKSEVKDDDQMKRLHEQLQQPDYVEALHRVNSPLCCGHILGDIKKDFCKVKTSKKRPLWLVWSNPDPMADIADNDFLIMFKNGDDLRQDMLTLQVIRLMDSIWKAEGLDLRMIPYGCMATGKDVGLIEGVRNSKTITSIQNVRGTIAAMQMDSSQLHRWIKERNSDRYDQAIDAFTKSCAGYCVATFVLGIGDRHPENIMVTEDGRVFHIDFGHFLDHKKKKFGINRERVPFVLTEDFIRVIAKGVDQPKKQKEYVNFQELCSSAYMILRKHSHLIITLFTLMLSCGIPELQSLDDIGYVRKTLAVEKDDQAAIKYFHTQFRSAYGVSWTTKFDWMCHNFKKKIN